MAANIIIDNKETYFFLQNNNIMIRIVFNLYESLMNRGERVFLS